MNNHDEREWFLFERRKLLRWLAAAPGALLLGRGLAGCGGSGSPAPHDADVDGGRGDAGRRGSDGGAVPDGATRDSAAIDAAPGSDGGPGDDGAVECDPTTRDAVGPFFESGAPMRTELAGPDEPGEPLRIEGRLLHAADCRTPLGGYGLDVWQADRDGNYHDAPDYRLRGRMIAADDGSFAFETIMPGHYPLGGSLRPAHIHVRVYSPDGGMLLTTQLYFEGDPYLGDEDPCQPPSCFSNDPDRVIRLRPATIGGKMGKMGMIPLFVAPESG